MTPAGTAVAAPSSRNSGIDALRGLSILLVLLNHIGIRVPLERTALGPFAPHWLWSSLTFNGSEAVIIFFVISGFLITGRSLERWGDLRHIPAGAFYRLRASRIVPLLLLLVAVLSIFHLAGVPQFVIHRPGQSLGGAVAAAFGLYLNWYEGLYGYLPGGWDVLWSLSIEEVFYLAFPLLCLSLGRMRLLVPSLIVLALSYPFSSAALIAHSNEVWQEKAYLPGMSAIAMGVLARLAVHRFPAPTGALTTPLGVMGLAGVATVLFAGHWVYAQVHEGYGLLLATAAAVAASAAHWRQVRRPDARLPGLGWLCSCGRLSYEIYLSHMFCVLGVLVLAGYGSVAGGATRLAPLAFLWYAAILPACWLLGLALARTVSQPAERALRAWAQAAAKVPRIAA
jgi:peptidoglycan/LPS O-acetylase OafA/YrhL